MNAVTKIIIFLLSFYSVFISKGATIKGIVQDHKNQESIIGAIIREKNNTNIGAATDFDGNFIIIKYSWG